MESFILYLDKQLERAATLATPERVFQGLLSMVGGVLVILFHYSQFPLTLEYLAFYSVLLLLFALYRPFFAFCLLVFTLPFEIITVGSFFGADIRLYQWLAVVLALAALLLLVQKKYNLISVRWYDLFLGLLLVGSILSLLGNGFTPAGIKYVLVITSVALLYGLGRFFIRTTEQLHAIFFTLLNAGVIVMGYALYQLWAFENNRQHLMVMPGRPNSTFAEADWLGFFLGLCFVVSVLWLVRSFHEKKRVALLGATTTNILFIVGIVTTVSRSAWLGVLLAIMVIETLLLLRDKKIFLWVTTALFGSLCVALSLIQVFNLTRFTLSERLESTATSNQNITIACRDERALPSVIDSVEALSSYDCRHINLEEEESERAAGKYIRHIERPDPNISLRKSIYQESIGAIREHWFFGLGAAASSTLFGVDGRGASLNSSNMFLETWLTTGIVGFVGLTSFWFLSGALIFRSLVRRRTLGNKWYILTGLLAVWIHTSVFNLFNAGILLGTFFLVLMLLGWYLEKEAPHIKNIWQQ